MRRAVRRLAVLVSIHALATLAVGPASLAGTIVVDGSDPACVAGSGQPDPYSIVYCTIEAALADALAGDLVQVAGGEYSPVGGRLVIDQALALAAADPLDRPIVHTNYMSWTDCAVQIAADGVVVDGFEIENSAAGSLVGYIAGDYGAARSDWTIRNCKIHHGRNAIRPIGDRITIESCDLHDTQSDLINAEYGNCYGLRVIGNWLHSHHTDLGGKPAGLTYTCSSTTPGAWADVEISGNYCWASRTFVDFQNSGGLAPANHILIAHNTVDYWMDALPEPPQASDLAQQMALAWWTSSGNWNGPNFEIRDNLFTRLKWYAVVDTDLQLQGAITLERNLFWEWYLVDAYYPAYAYTHEWPAARGAIGWEEMGAGNEFVMLDCATGDPLYSFAGTRPDNYYALSDPGSPAYQSATDGTNIGAWQGLVGPPLTPTPAATATPEPTATAEPTETPEPTATPVPPLPAAGPAGIALLAGLLGILLARRRGR